MAKNKTSEVKAQISKKFVEHVLSSPDYYPSSDKFLESLNAWPVKALRANTKLISVEKLCEELQIPLAQVPWCESASYFDFEARVGSSTQHEEGLFYIGDPSAMSLVEKLDIQPDSFVVDLCAAPGGKSVHVLNFLSSSGTLVSNDVDYRRTKTLEENVNRMTKNLSKEEMPTIVIKNESIENLVRVFSGLADVVILDAPCSGEAMMRRSNTARRQWSQKLVSKMSQLQKELLSQAALISKPGGVIGYSTCTFNRFENEDIYKFGVEQLGLKTNRKIGFDKKFDLYPHLVSGDGQRVCVFKVPD